MSVRWKLAAAVVAVLAAAGVGIGLTIGLRGQPEETATASAPALTPTQQMRLQQGIIAPTVAEQAKVVALEVRSQFERGGKPLLPVGSRLVINARTFHQLSLQFAAVDATVRGPEPGRWQLFLVRETGQWLLLDTKRLP